MKSRQKPPRAERSSGTGAHRRAPRRRLRWLALARRWLAGARRRSAQAGTGGASSPLPNAPTPGGHSSSARCARPAPPGTARASTATTPPAARPCGPDTVGVAHRSLPCGTTVKFVYHGRSLVTRVIDRGPYTPGNALDLTNGARRALGFEGVGAGRATRSPSSTPATRKRRLNAGSAAPMANLPASGRFSTRGAWACRGLRTELSTPDRLESRPAGAG